MASRAAGYVQVRREQADGRHLRHGLGEERPPQARPLPRPLLRRRRHTRPARQQGKQEERRWNRHYTRRSCDGVHARVQGAVSVRFLLHGTSFCFVCCHLASGGEEGDALLRNADAADIFARTSFHGAVLSPEELPKKILDHE
jgi:hypothetical protein